MEHRTPTPVSQQVDKESVRLLAIEFGVREAARRTGLNEDRVRQWSSRYKWLSQSPHTTSVTTVTKPGDIMLGELADHEAATRMSLARSARRMAKDCEGLPARHAKIAHTVAQTASIVHKWGNQDQQDRGFTLNVLNLGSLGLSIGDEAPSVQGE